MPTTTVKTIGSSGADYSTLQAWEDAKPANLTTSIAGGEIWEGRCQNQVFDGGSGPLLVIGGSTTNASGYAHLTTAPGASFRDNASVQSNALRYNSANGAALTSANYNNPVISITEGYARLSNLQIRNTNGAPASVAIRVSGGNVRIDNVIAETSGGTGISGGVIAHDSGANFVLTNSLLVMRAASANRVLFGFGTITVANCTIAVPANLAAAANGIAIQYATDCVIRNTAVFGVVNVGPTSGINPVTWTNCYTDENTALPSGVTTIAYDTATGAQFENISDGTHDYRIKTGSSLKNAGATDTVYGTPSINNLARPQGAGYDVGAWELFEAPPPPTLVLAASMDAFSSDLQLAQFVPNTLTISANLDVFVSGLALAQQPGVINFGSLTNGSGFRWDRSDITATIKDRTTDALIATITGVTSGPSGGSLSHVSIVSGGLYRVTFRIPAGGPLPNGAEGTALLSGA